MTAGKQKTIIAAMERMRIDLDGVPLKDQDGRVLCIFRFRTVAGLVFAIPESVDVMIPWSAIEEASVDLVNGQLKVVFKANAPERPRWLGEFNCLEGQWTDRALLTRPPA
ncbi:MAG: hypothetical protein AB1489_00720 [Acidobacteriota bacterium]